jgi:hypothetical protein
MSQFLKCSNWSRKSWSKTGQHEEEEEDDKPSCISPPFQSNPILLRLRKIKYHHMLNTVPTVAKMAKPVKIAGKSKMSPHLHKTMVKNAEPNPKNPVKAHPKSPQSVPCTS